MEDRAPQPHLFASGTQDHMSNPAIDAAIDRLTEASMESLDLRAFMEALIRQFGGPAEFALELYKDFQATTPGSQNRIRLEALILSCWDKVTFPQAPLAPKEVEDTLRVMLKEVAENET
jgi:hypothetical protein